VVLNFVGCRQRRCGLIYKMLNFRTELLLLPECGAVVGSLQMRSHPAEHWTGALSVNAGYQISFLRPEEEKNMKDCAENYM
jgi:hypothetical protein